MANKNSVNFIAGAAVAVVAMAGLSFLWPEPFLGYASWCYEARFGKIQEEARAGACTCAAETEAPEEAAAPAAAETEAPEEEAPEAEAPRADAEVSKDIIASLDGDELSLTFLCFAEEGWPLFEMAIDNEEGEVSVEETEEPLFFTSLNSKETWVTEMQEIGYTPESVEYIADHRDITTYLCGAPQIKSWEIKGLTLKVKFEEAPTENFSFSDLQYNLESGKVVSWQGLAIVPPES